MIESLRGHTDDVLSVAFCGWPPAAHIVVRQDGTALGRRNRPIASHLYRTQLVGLVGCVFAR